MNTWYDDKYKFYHCDGYSNLYKVADSNWNGHHFVSKDKDGNIIGYFSYSIDRADDRVHSLSVINFSNNKLTFGQDLIEMLHNIFEKFNFRKLTYTVVVGNPIEKSYDKMTKKYGGRVVGTYRNHVRLIDHQFYDWKLYEISREDYLMSKQNLKSKRKISVKS